MALTKDDKEFIQLSLKPIEIEISGVKDHLGRINGEVQKHSDKIADLEDEVLNVKATKKFVTRTVAIAGGVIAALWGVVQIVSHLIQ